MTVTIGTPGAMVVAEMPVLKSAVEHPPVTPQAASRSAARRDAPVRCPSCGREVRRKARQQVYCSTRCREREKAKKRCRKAGIGSGTGAPPNPHKFVNKNNALQGPIRPQRLDISAPAAIIHRELWAGRRWEHAVTDDGVPCMVARAGVREAAYG